MTPGNILLDVGGTFIKCSDGRSIPVDSNGSREEICASFREAVGSTGNIARVAVAMPGPFDYSKGIFLMKHKFAAVYGESFADVAGLPAGTSLSFAHDVVAMLLGEVGPGSPNTALATLGTGLGFAMFVDGKVLTNELGSPAVSIYNRPYRDGTLEDYASKRGITAAYGDNSLTVKEIAQRAFAGDAKAAEAFAQAGRVMGEGIAQVLADYGVRTLLLGGQISRSAALIIPALQAKLPAGIEIRTISDFDNATFRGLSRLE